MPDVLQKAGPMTGMGGMRPPQRVPNEWEKRPLEMTKESPQGPEVTSRPTMRSLAPGAESRSGLAPLPGEVVTVLEEGGGFTAQMLAGRPGMQRERSVPGESGNLSVGSGTGEEQAKGSATRVTGKAVIGGTAPKGMF